MGKDVSMEVHQLSWQCMPLNFAFLFPWSQPIMTLVAFFSVQGRTDRLNVPPLHKICNVHQVCLYWNHHCRKQIAWNNLSVYFQELMSWEENTHIGVLQHSSQLIVYHAPDWLDPCGHIFFRNVHRNTHQDWWHKGSWPAGCHGNMLDHCWFSVWDFVCSFVWFNHTINKAL